MSLAIGSLQNRELMEEIEAINAIYEPTTITVTGTTNRNEPRALDFNSSSVSRYDATVILQIPSRPNLSFIIGFDEEYPDTPPRVVGTASTNVRGEGKIAVGLLEEIVRRTHHLGQVCLFDVIHEASEKFEELKIGGKEIQNREAPEAAPAVNAIIPSTELPATLSLRATFGCDSPPWVLSDTVTEKKSVFVGRAAQVSSRDQAESYLEHLIATDRKVAAATHNISAWRIREKRGSTADASMTTVQDCDDDGETAAGGRLLHLMQLMDVWDVVVVVSRWYGGVKLGPDRFRIINNAGRDALIKGGFAKIEGAGIHGKGKRKGKK
jgi:Uncharacterized protein family UPF0029/RWD domain